MSSTDIDERLDELPCFVIVDALRQPPPGTEDRYRVHVDAATAEAELADARARHPDLDLRVVAVGMGFGFGRPAAVVTPSAAEVQLAQALPGGDEIDWITGDAADNPTLPIFGCFSLRQLDAEDRLVTPLFLCCDDAELALATAEEATGTPPGPLRSTSVQEMTRMMAAGELSDPQAMKFVPPTSSVRLCARLDAELLSSGGSDETEDETAEDDEAALMERPTWLEDEVKAAAASPDLGEARRALTSLFDGDRRSRGARDAGLFPADGHDDGPEC